MNWTLKSVVGVLIFFAAGSSVWAAPVNYNAQEILANFGNLNQSNNPAPGATGTIGVGPNSFPNVVGGPNYFCAPTATMNSFIYLTNTYPAIYGNSLMGGQANWVAAAQLLAGPGPVLSPYMNTAANAGTSGDGFVNGKANYIMTNAPAGSTALSGMDSEVLVARPLWCQNANPSAAFLYNQLNDNDDVEIGIVPNAGGAGHVMTLTGITWADNNSNGVFDAGDTLSINVIDPANPGAPNNIALALTAPAVAGNPFTLNYSGAAYSLITALSESPVPEPASMSLLAAGGLVLLARRRRAA